MEPSCKRMLQKDEFEVLLESEWKDYQTTVEFVLARTHLRGAAKGRNTLCVSRVPYESLNAYTLLGQSSKF